MPVYDPTFDPPAPLARVALRNSANSMTVSGVPMLIDTGADVTLVPRASIEPLGLSVANSIEYEIMGYDGSLSVALAVDLDLIFLGKVFRGRVLLDKRDYGILGRDILNHIRVLLDGPRLTWSEVREI